MIGTIWVTTTHYAPHWFEMASPDGIRFTEWMDDAATAMRKRQSLERLGWHTLRQSDDRR